MAEQEGSQAPLIPKGAQDPPAPKLPQAPHGLQTPQQPVLHMLPLNWSHFKPKFSGEMIRWTLIDFRKMIKFRDFV